ncbi:MAG TPA: hypothetical protein VF491_13000 [Vicinamibacterales bacterium]|jgi:hypothetical protein
MMPGPIARPLPTERVRSAVRIAAVISGAALVAFHGGLFAAQAAEGRLDEPWLVVRWLIAAGVVAALAAIRRVSGSIWSRRGLAVWVLAAMLHGPAVANEFAHPINSPALPETSPTSVLQSLVSVSALAAALWMLAGLLGLRNRQSRLSAIADPADVTAAMFGDGFSPRCFSRPPPRLD